MHLKKYYVIKRLYGRNEEIEKRLGETLKNNLSEDVVL